MVGGRGNIFESLQILVGTVDVHEPRDGCVGVDAQIGELHIVPCLCKICQSLQVHLRYFHQYVVHNPESEENFQQKSERVRSTVVQGEAARPHLYGWTQTPPRVCLNGYAHCRRNVVVRVVGVDVHGEAARALVRPPLAPHGGHQPPGRRRRERQVHHVAEAAHVGQQQLGRLARPGATVSSRVGQVGAKCRTRHVTSATARSTCILCSRIETSKVGHPSQDVAAPEGGPLLACPRALPVVCVT
mmetsp:Transcript_26173/g.75059  ORF Transcript_26173/g.75059 Transcript_26173/m.75059 type:complete len:244 (+) Transcript_26173:1318-2049(+)